MRSRVIAMFAVDDFLRVLAAAWRNDDGTWAVYDEPSHGFAGKAVSGSQALRWIRDLPEVANIERKLDDGTVLA